MEILSRINEYNDTKIAISDGDGSITYQELNALSNQMAAFLLSCNVTQGDIIGLYMEMSIEYIISVLAVMKTGAVFAPLDRNSPEERIKTMINDINPVMIIENTEEQKIEKSILFSLKSKTIIDSDHFHFRLEDFSKENPAVEFNGTDPAYIFFTSGSTGVPKAILGQHKGLFHFIKWQSSEYRITEECIVGGLTPMAFDPSLRDIFLPLYNHGTLHIPNQKKMDFHERAKWIIEKRIELIHIVPSVYEKIHEELSVLENKDSVALKYLFFAGEPLFTEKLKLWTPLLPADVQLINLYGPTETSLAKVHYKIESTDIHKSGIMPLGLPINDTEVYIIDENNQILESGNIGEIAIKTEYRSLGYLRKELNEGRFVLLNGDTVYKTGDLGMKNEEGFFEYRGRKDHQIKINGVRIEIGEIEAAILKYDEVKNCCVVYVQQEEIASVLVGVFTAHQDVDTDSLRGFLQKYLPSGMIPSQFIQVENLPYNQNGKIDRATLQRNIEEQLLSSEENENEKHEFSQLENEIYEVWKDVLKKENIGPNDNFYELGGHSLNGLVIISRLFKALNVPIEIDVFFENPTIRALADYIQKHLSDTSENQILDHSQEKSSQPEQDPYELSGVQKSIYLANEISGQSSVYNIHGAFKIRGEVHVEALEKALIEVIKRHQPLRTLFIKDDEGNVLQKVISEQDITSELAIENLNSINDAYEHLEKIFSTAFDLQKERLLKVGIIRFDGDQVILYYCMHHIIADGWSLEVFFHDLLYLYNRISNNLENDLAPLKLQYRDYVSREINEKQLEASKNYWLEKLSGEIPVLNFPTSYPRPSVQTYSGSSLKFEIPEEVYIPLKKLCSDHHITYFNGLLSCLYVLLHKYTGQKDIIVGAPVANRDDIDFQNHVGLFINTVPYRLMIEEGSSFKNILASAKKIITEANKYSKYPFSELVEDLNIAKDPSHSPLFDIMVNFQTGLLKNKLENGDIMEKINTPQLKSKFDLSFYFQEMEGQSGAVVIYNTDLFTSEFIRQLWENFICLTEELLKNISTDIAKLTYVSAQQRDRIINEFNSSDSIDIPDTSISQLFEDISGAIPSKTAIIYKNELFSYSYLREKVNRLCHYLEQEYQILPQSKVIVVLERNQWLPVTFLAILKLKAIYIPIDNKHPESFVYSVAEECKSNLIIDAAFIKDFLERENQYSSEYDAELNVQNEINTIIYTTGSTGKPKGVIIKNKNILNRLFWMWNKYPFHNGEVCALKTSIGFVDHIWELFGPLLKGCTLLCINSEITNIPVLVDTLNQHKVNRIILVPTLLKEILEYIDHENKTLDHLKYWTSSGEELSKSLKEKFYSIFNRNQHTLINIYGSTEVTADATYFDFSGRKQTHLPIYDARIEESIDLILQKYNASNKIINSSSIEEILKAFKTMKMQAPVSSENYMKFLDGVLLPNMVNVNHTKFIGHMTGPIPDFSLSISNLVVKLNQNLVKVETSAAATMIENQVIEELHKMIFNLPESFYINHSHQTGGTLGIFTNGGTLSNITAMYNIINKLLPADQSYRGYQESGLIAGLRHYGYERVVIMGSRWCHYSIEKALKLFGLGRDSFVELLFENKSDKEIEEAVNQKIEELKKENTLILSIVGIAGTTESGVVEPLSLLGKIAREHQIHFHVDAAFGGAFIFSEKYKHLLSGIEEANSITICAHKQLLLPIGSSFCLFADPLMTKFAEHHTHYQARKNSYDLGKFTIEGTRNFNSLILHSLLQVFGKEGIAKVVETNFETSQYFISLLKNTTAFEVFESHDLNIVLYRYIPFSLRNKTSFTSDEIRFINDINVKLQKIQFERGNSFVSYTKIKTAYSEDLQVFLRTVFLNPYTSQEDLREILIEQENIAQEIDPFLKNEWKENTHQLSVLGDKKEPITIGKPISNVRIYIFDTNMQIVPVGVEGIIYIGGHNVTEGYYQDDELTGNKFVPNPLNPEEILFRTDDVGKWSSEGNIIYLGRNDFQYKIRGNRIDLQYIEENVVQISKVKDAVIVFKDEQLIAYLIADKDIEFTAVHEALRKSIPVYMIPNQFILLDSFPQTSNGKIDRKKLNPELGILLTDNRAYESARDTTEEKILEFWSVLFEDKKISVHDDFFLLGGHSLHLMKLIQLYRNAFNVDISIEAMFLNTSIAQHAMLIRDGKNSWESISKAPDLDSYPLTDGQIKMWEAAQSVRSSASHHMTGALSVYRDLDTELFCQAVKEVVKRHEALRTNYIIGDNHEVRQIITPYEQTSFEIEVIEASDWSVEEIKKYVKEKNDLLFDLSKDPLLRVILFKKSSDHFIFAYCVHHIASDMRSMKIFAGDLWYMYQYLSSVEAISLAPLAIQYKDYAYWYSQNKGAFYARNNAFYSKQLKDYTSLDLPTDHNRPAIKTYHGKTYYFKIGSEIYKGLKKQTEDYGVTPFIFLFSALNTLFYKYTQQEDITLGVTVENRKHIETGNLIGFFVETLPFRTMVVPPKDFRFLCQTIQEQFLQYLHHTPFSFNEVVKEIGERRNPSRLPLFDVMVNYENYEENRAMPQQVEPLIMDKETAQYDLLFGIRENEESFDIKIEYNTDLYESDTIERIAEHFTNIVISAIDNGALELYKLDYLTLEEKNN
ncbi:amino acid adenylation domain-containing protein [Chryseobacterium indologenes]|uniref:non-ribosomal peptide synthetase n=1 Tax=Chryseobacterium indologenes TaxID=253 RepID=UPI0023E78619|nr:non-ribosomal peptide synthetase [Chryseobacterium indologenes]WET49150.1 amino acid adenylation domain-containing protein [Chryseobacterium indologenes]